MCKLRALFLLLLLLHSVVASVSAQGSATKWPTLTGNIHKCMCTGNIHRSFSNACVLCSLFSWSLASASDILVEFSIPCGVLLGLRYEGKKR